MTEDDQLYERLCEELHAALMKEDIWSCDTIEAAFYFALDHGQPIYVLWTMEGGWISKKPFSMRVKELNTLLNY